MHLYVVSNSEASELLRSRIGDALRQERLSQGKTLKELATDANLSPSHLSDIERGEKEASSEILRSINHSLGMKLDELLRRATHNAVAELMVAA